MQLQVYGFGTVATGFLYAMEHFSQKQHNSIKGKALRIASPQLY